MEGKDEKNVSLREFAKYVKADEKKSGVTIEEVDYRPNANGCTFSLDVIDAIISALQEVRAEMLEEKPAKKKGIKKAN
jgi:hypothetical protein